MPTAAPSTLDVAQSCARYLAAWRWRMSGTNTGPSDPPGFAPTGRAVAMQRLLTRVTRRRWP